MKDAIVLETADIKQILAEKYNVPINNVTKTQYSYIIIKGDKENENDNILRQ